MVPWLSSMLWWGNSPCSLKNLRPHAISKNLGCRPFDDYTMWMARVLSFTHRRGTLWLGLQAICHWTISIAPILCLTFSERTIFWFMSKFLPMNYDDKIWAVNHIVACNLRWIVLWRSPTLRHHASIISARTFDTLWRSLKTWGLHDELDYWFPPKELLACKSTSNCVRDGKMERQGWKDGATWSVTCRSIFPGSRGRSLMLIHAFWQGQGYWDERSIGPDCRNAWDDQRFGRACDIPGLGERQRWCWQTKRNQLSHATA